MKNSNNQRRQSILLATIATLFIFTAFGSTFAQTGIGAKYGARDPRTCANSKLPKIGAPSAAQAAQYVICDSEHEVNYLYLVDNVTVQIGKGRRYNIREDINFPDIDTRFLVYPIRGSFKKYSCDKIYLDRTNLNRNCSVYDEPNAKGACYKNSFGDWKCGMTDASGKLTDEYMPPPGGAKAATKDKPTAQNDTPTKNRQPAKTTAETENRDASGYAKPDFSAMEQWYEIVKYEYAPLEHSLYVYIKPKVDYTNRPTEFRMEFRDRDGILLQDLTVSPFHQMPGTREGAIGETLKVYIRTPPEKLLGQVATAKVIKVE